MTSRYQYGGDVSDFTYAPQVAGSRIYVTLLANTVTTFWSAQTGGTQYTDLLDANNNPVTNISTDANGNLPIFQGPAGITAMWADAGGGRRIVHPTGSGSSLDADTANNVGNPSSLTATALAATFASKAPATEVLLYVSTSGNDSNDGLSPGAAKATIGGALTAAGSARAHIKVGPGTFNITAVDASGNCVTLGQPSMILEGEGVDRTVINIGVNCNWGIVSLGARCQVRGIQVTTSSGVTVTYGMVGLSTTNKTSGSAEGATFTKVYCAPVSGSTVNACFAVGNDTTGGSIDLAFQEFQECVASGANVTTHGFYLGNGTGGNILLTGLSDCQANACVNGLTAASTGFTWLRGGMSGNTTYDFNYLGGVVDTVVIEGGRFENGKRFFNSNNSLGPFSGFTLIGNNLGNYTPSDNILINSGSNCAFVMLGGQYGMTQTANDSSLITISSNNNLDRSFVAIGVMLANPAGWPAATTHIHRTILGASTMDGTGHIIANNAYQHIIDGGIVRAEVTKTANYSFGIWDSIVISNGTTLTHSLPDPTVVNAGVPYSVVNINASSCTVNSQGTSKTINGAASLSLGQWETGTWFSDGTQWIALTSANPSSLPFIPKVPAANLATANGTYTIPGSGTVIMRITATGGGAGGGGGGSALTSGGTSTQVGGGAGGAGNTTVSIQSIAAGTVLTHTIGAGGAGGSGGAANSNAGGTGTLGSSTTVTGSGLTTITALGGGGCAGGGANSASAAGGGYGGTGRSSGSAGTTTVPLPGSGGQAASSNGYGISAPFPPYGQSGGQGGAPANATNGGVGGSAGAIGGLATISNPGGSGTTSGTNGASAANNSGCGGGGGGGGAPGGAGGNGGTGGSGWVLYEVIG